MVDGIDTFPFAAGDGRDFRIFSSDMAEKYLF